MRDLRLRDIFFAKQVIINACATQAIISVLLNISHSDMELGPVLSEFKEFAKCFDPPVIIMTDSSLRLCRAHCGDLMYVYLL